MELLWKYITIGSSKENFIIMQSDLDVHMQNKTKCIY